MYDKLILATDGLIGHFYNTSVLCTGASVGSASGAGAGGVGTTVCVQSSPGQIQNVPGASNFINPVNTALSVIQFLSYVLAVGVIAIIGIRIIGARAGNNPDGAAKALGGLPWVLGGLILVGSATTIVDLVF